MSRHVELEGLIAWWLGELDPADADAVDEHLIDCAACSARGQRVAALAGGIGEHAARGQFAGVLPAGLVDRLVARGVRVRTFEVRAGEHVPCAASADDDLMNARLIGDFRGTGRLDVAVLGPDGGEQERYADVLVDRAAGVLDLAAPADQVRALPPMPTTICSTPAWSATSAAPAASTSPCSIPAAPRRSATPTSWSTAPAARST
ncbi:MAG TPA: zf-HC2 domain-containing protein [Kofleriaceae bacterium]|nr:zf-HC2 domain-containing protein [Kofleriaceae bacterium]